MTMNRLLASAVALVSVLALSVDSAPASPVPLQRASSVVPEASLLDVHIVAFDAAEDFFPEVRRAEARYVPVGLKRVLETTGFWGAVRVVPDAGHTDLTISGAVVASHGGELRLEVRAMDATGKVWLDKKYKGKPDASVYLDPKSTDDPSRFHCPGWVDLVMVGSMKRLR